MVISRYTESCFEKACADTRPWRVVHTRARHEKKLADECDDQNIPYFLPLKRYRVRKDGRIYETDIPLFSCYMFVRCSSDEKNLVRRTGHVASVLEVKDQTLLEEDLLRVKKAIDVSAPVEPYPFAKVGTWVRIARGPFEGLEGQIVRRRSEYRFVINVRMINQAVAVEVDAEFMTQA